MTSEPPYKDDSLCSKEPFVRRNKVPLHMHYSPRMELALISILLCIRATNEEKKAIKGYLSYSVKPPNLLLFWSIFNSAKKKRLSTIVYLFMFIFK